MTAKTLYVSDLDGTLLRSDARTSDYTNRVINRLTAQGLLFSYATARSPVTAKKVTAGLDARIPIIVYNGAFIVDNASGELLLANYFDRAAVQALLDELFAQGIYPIVYSHEGGRERLSYIPELSTPGMKRFTDSRAGDVRETIVHTAAALRSGDIFYITCIDEPEKLLPFYQKYGGIFHCEYQTDIYTGDRWLEIMPREASKANAIRQLRAMYGCGRLVVFGDGRNDIDMFELADESYAVANAHESLKARATGVIGSNDEDSVARWLEQVKGNE